MTDHAWLAQQFEANRTQLRSVAYRLLGSTSEAEDAVQEAWLRLQRTDSDSVENLAAWLTTVVARVSLNMLQSRKVRREDPITEDDQHLPAPPAHAPDPEHEALQADSIGLALLVVLDQLAPAERLAFVLHDLFAIPFDEIGPILDKTPAAARQLASRARRRVQGSPAPAADNTRQRQVVDAFLTASRGGDFQALLSLLAPDAVFRADPAGIRMGSEALVSGRDGVAATFAGRAKATRLALIDGAIGAVWAIAGKPKVVFTFTVVDGQVTAIDLRADTEELAGLDIELLETA
ncbi:sigma-70 family RNA polymerase sigma factor [Nocardia sp. NPDC059240]|uniref:sigma-70 family RNA polymerase sigma factor n=1 Tax=Nocardia sp. NPDC059240 TaxID=3346786 RepID=UPI003679E436